MDPVKLTEETEITLRNRKSLMANRNLLYWYKKLYEQQFARFPDLEQKKILEIGSGTSPLTLFVKHAKTSDIMPLGYVDYTFNAEEIDAFTEIPDESLDIITLTNVLHHLRDPRAMLVKAAKKLRRGGAIVLTEPYLSLLSTPIYRHFHYEPTDLNIKSPVQSEITGPLSSANNALPYKIFTSSWADQLRDAYDFSDRDRSYFTWISYMATGGIRRNFGIPGFLYKTIFHADLALSRLCPNIFASFFTQVMIRR
ncbi:MAG: methyltransferase domain-containing protein [Candidatus Omnitrophota bacterium]